jgi:hypothetical protein
VNLQNDQVSYSNSFVCPACGRLLSIPQIYSVLRAYTILMALAVTLYLLGTRGYALLFGALVGWIPALFLDAKIGRAFLPPLVRLDKWPNSNITTLRL